MRNENLRTTILLLSQGKYTEAEPLLKRAVSIFEQVLGQGNLSTALVGQYAGLLLEYDTRCPSGQTLFPQSACRASYCTSSGDHDGQKRAYPKAFKELKAEGNLPQDCELRQVKYLNTIVEQDHRFIKRLVKLGMGFYSLETAWRTLQGYEVMNMMRKGQVQGRNKGDITSQIAFISRLFGVAA